MRQVKRRNVGLLMPFLCWIMMFSAAAHAGPAARFVPGMGDGEVVSLQEMIERAADGDTLILAAGVFSAGRTEMIDSLCGNCEEHRTPVRATAGFIIKGKGLVILGRGAGRTILETNAGYGVYFEDSDGSVLSGLTVTGGRRDPDGNATDAAVVARRSSVTVTDCEITDNTSRIDTVVVGIGGVFGREGAELVVRRTVIRNNGWDGVALYRGASAFIADNEISGGRGAGIGITWDAVATVLRNRISGYWKGIGTFGDSRAVVRENIVHDNLGWGIIATGTSWLDASNNIVHRNGNCGLAVWSETCRARFTNNIVTENGWREEWVCPCVGAWMTGPNGRAEFSYNNIWGNEEGNYANMPDLTGTDGNRSIDPGFPGDGSYRLPADSPLIDSGNPLLTDPDGTRSDIGLERRNRSGGGAK
jgi:hypothetical protein